MGVWFISSLFPSPPPSPLQRVMRFTPSCINGVQLQKKTHVYEKRERERDFSSLLFLLFLSVNGCRHTSQTGGRKNSLREREREMLLLYITTTTTSRNTFFLFFSRLTVFAFPEFLTKLGHWDQESRSKKKKKKTGLPVVDIFLSVFFFSEIASPLPSLFDVRAATERREELPTIRLCET